VAPVATPAVPRDDAAKPVVKRVRKTAAKPADGAAKPGDAVAKGKDGE
jgi:hypothetical protein